MLMLGAALLVDATAAAFYAAGATDASRHPGQVPGKAAAASLWV